MKDDKSLDFSLKIYLLKDSPSFGPGVIRILELVQENGSLSKAYREMGLSSSKGWRILKRAEEDLGFDLVESSSGGKGGGQSRLSERGRELLDNYRNFSRELDEVSRELFEKHFK